MGHVNDDLYSKVKLKLISRISPRMLKSNAKKTQLGRLITKQLTSFTTPSPISHNSNHPSQNYQLPNNHTNINPYKSNHNIHTHNHNHKQHRPLATYIPTLTAQPTPSNQIPHPISIQTWPNHHRLFQTSTCKGVLTVCGNQSPSNVHCPTHDPNHRNHHPFEKQQPNINRKKNHGKISINRQHYQQ